ncbi:sigma-70 family RNA polymerase sigma factor [Aeoliella sp.]|uniref:sigma-70 family RNA polymerase sigma factor n=1 Tax=Aeoliella sp. TaxID=2795800 RepID=UPI003CCB7B80
MADTPHVDLNELSDRALVRRFAQSRDEEAFRQLVERHGPLVMATCRRGLNSSSDADDAFQATFLVLARSAGKIRKRDSVAAWLYGAATRIAMRMRREASRRTTHELMEIAAPESDPLDELLARHDGTVADEELNQLPETLRTPLVLRYLAGRSNAEVAEELGITIAALEGRLKRGKQRLRVRLLRRGVTLAVLVATLKATRVSAGEISAELTGSTVDLAISGSSATISALASEPTTSTHIALQELGAMNATILSKPIVAAAMFGGVLAATLTAQVAFSQGEANQGTDPFALDAAAPAATSEEPASSTQVTAARPAKPDPFGAEPIAEDNPYAADPVLNRSATAPLGSSSQAGPRIVDLKPRSKTELKIEQALTKPLNNLGLEFQGAPLSEIVNFLRDEYNIEVQLDLRSLEDMAISPDEPVNVNLRNISLESALNIMLAQIDLTYVVENEVLLILNQDDEQARLETRVYPVPTFDDFELTSLMSVVAPTTWETKGGAGTMTVLGDRLLVRQNYRVHRELNELLSQLMNTEAAKTDAAIREAEMGISDDPKPTGFAF